MVRVGERRGREIGKGEDRKGRRGRREEGEERGERRGREKREGRGGGGRGGGVERWMEDRDRKVLISC